MALDIQDLIIVLCGAATDVGPILGRKSSVSRPPKPVGISKSNWEILKTLDAFARISAPAERKVVSLAMGIDADAVRIWVAVNEPDDAPAAPAEKTLVATLKHYWEALGEYSAGSYTLADKMRFCTIATSICSTKIFARIEKRRKPFSTFVQLFATTQNEKVRSDTEYGKIRDLLQTTKGRLDLVRRSMSSRGLAASILWLAGTWEATKLDEDGGLLQMFNAHAREEAKRTITTLEENNVKGPELEEARAMAVFDAPRYIYKVLSVATDVKFLLRSARKADLHKVLNKRLEIIPVFQMNTSPTAPEAMPNNSQPGRTPQLFGQRPQDVTTLKQVLSDAYEMFEETEGELASEPDLRGTAAANEESQGADGLTGNIGASPEEKIEELATKILHRLDLLKDRPLQAHSECFLLDYHRRRLSLNAYRVIGCSKLSCHLCNLYFQGVRVDNNIVPRFTVTGTHDGVTPWIPPPDLPVNIETYMRTNIMHLIGRVAKGFVMRGQSTSERQGSPESDADDIDLDEIYESERNKEEK